MMDSNYKWRGAFEEETNFYNRIVLGSFLPENLWGPLPRCIQGWLRSYIGGTLLYFISGTLWCFYIYYLKQNLHIPKEAIPTNKAMLLQISVAMKAIPFYVMLPPITEYMVENGWTRCFPSISDLGLVAYIGNIVVYLTIVEFGIYWMHRVLHDIKPLYKYLHASHHIYNKQNTLSPFAGLAFHPLDGYHTIHHTTYRHNYGHYTIWLDKMFGTLRDPEEETAAKMI